MRWWKKDRILKVGAVIVTDHNGFLVNRCSLDKIVSPWSEAVSDIKEAYTRYLGSDLHSIYVRGSVAQGTAVQKISDIDTLAICRGDENPAAAAWIPEYAAGFRPRFPFASGAELQIVSRNRLLNPSRGGTILRLVIGTMSVCIHGENLIPTLPKFKPGKETFLHASTFPDDISGILSDIEKFDNQATEMWCRWVMKRIVRTGYELVMERENAFCRDLYPCYEAFCRYYPNHASQMRRALELSINPTSDKKVIRSILNELGSWMVQELQNALPDKAA